MSRLVHQTVRSDKFNDHNLRERFLERLRDCDVLRALVDIVPAYDKLLPSTKPIPEGLSSVHKILYPAIAHVLTETRKFCDEPIVLFFDDVQWMDPGSKGVLSYLLENYVPVLTIVAFRDRTSQSTFTLQSLLDKNCMNSSQMKFCELSLHNLSEKYVKELVHKLPLSNEDRTKLFGFIYKQTEGNPFFLQFRLSMMAATGALTYDADSRLWRLNPDRVDFSTEVTTADAVEYCVSALGTLDHDVSSVLCRLAMMSQGLTLDEYISILEDEKGIVDLAKLKSCTVPEVIRKAVTVCVQKNLLIRSGSGFRFAHDRLQHSALQKAGMKESCEIHYYLGKQALSAADSTREQAFHVLDHFSKSREFVKDPDLILRIGTIMADICAFYITAGSHEQLDGMLEFVRGLLEKLDSEQRNADPFTSLEVRLLIAHHEIKFLMNDLDAAGDLFDEVRPHLKSASEIRDAYHTRISLLINIGSHREAIEATCEALARLDDVFLPQGLELPDGQPAAIVGEVTAQIKGMLTENPEWDIMRVAASLAVSTDEDHNFRVEIMIGMIPSLYLTGLFELYLYVPAMACKRILEHGATRSAGNAFSVLGFAVVAMFGDSFGAEIAMLGKHLVDRFNNQVTTCRAYSLSGVAIIYDERYEHMASRMLFASYAAGRSAHDILWSLYAVYLLSVLLLFQGVALSEMVSTLEDPFVYAMNIGHQPVAQRGLRSVLHTVAILRGAKSREESVVWHFSIPSDETTKSEPLIGFTHGVAALVALYFEQQLEIAWKIICEIVANDLDKAAPGLPPFYIFHFYAVVVAHGLLVNSMTSDGSQHEHHQLLEEECDELKKQMKSSTEELYRLSGMARVFRPYFSIADACVTDVIEDNPVDALQKFESISSHLKQERLGKNYDLLAISQLISAGICQRKKLGSVQHMYNTMALSTLEKWGAHGVVKRLFKTDMSPESNVNPLLPHGSVASTQVTSSTIDGHIGGSASRSRLRGNGPDFASVLARAGYITSFSTFEELTTRLCTTLVKQATATRLVLFIKNQKTGTLEPTAESTLTGMVPPESLHLKVEYSGPIVKVTEQLQEHVIVHSAQQESPHCFEPYIQRSGVCSIASLPISYRGSLIACVYMEHGFRQGRLQKMCDSFSALVL